MNLESITTELTQRHNVLTQTLNWEENRWDIYKDDRTETCIFIEMLTTAIEHMNETYLSYIYGDDTHMVRIAVFIENAEHLTNQLREKYNLSARKTGIRLSDPPITSELDALIGKLGERARNAKKVLIQALWAISPEIQKGKIKSRVRTSELEKELQKTKEEQNFLETGKEVLDSCLSIDKEEAEDLQHNPAYPWSKRYKKQYSLWLGKSRVFLYKENGDCEYLFGTSKNKPLVIRKVNSSRIFRNENVARMAKKLLGLKTGDYCTFDGYVIDEEMAEIIANYFNQVRKGEEILPSRGTDKVLKAQNPFGGKKSERKAIALEIRTWSQEFLKELGPDKIKVGELLGSGGSYLAFFFGNKVAVEFDQTEHATYLFEKFFYKTLKSWTRGEIRLDEPEGYLGRCVHQGARETWEESIFTFLCA